METLDLGAGRWREYPPSELSAPLQAALEVFAERGYDGASIRQVASRAGLSVPGLYHHYPSKQALLVSLVTEVMHDVLARTKAALSEAGTDPSARFDAVVECLLRYHMVRRERAFVAATELRSIDGDARAAYVALRDEQQRMIDDVVEAGVRADDFTTRYPLDASRAVTTMCVAVATWYKPDGPLDPEEIVARYLDIARHAVGARSSD